MKIERYKKLYKEEDSLSNLIDVSIPLKLKNFILKNPFPTDRQLHDFAKENNISPDDLEQYVYAFLTLILVGGASKGKDVEVSKENMDIGHKIEMEHVSYDTDNEVAKAMQEILVHKIACDHIFENPTYYLGSVNFKDELEQEGK